MQEYVLGLAFDTRFSNVLLIRKNRPAWQAGLLNGIGGKIEPDEDDIDALVREFREETGIANCPADWTPFGEMTSDKGNFRISLFWASDYFIYDAESVTDERVQVYEVLEILQSMGEGVVSNLPMLIATVLDRQFRIGEATLKLEYSK